MFPMLYIYMDMDERTNNLWNTLEMNWKFFCYCHCYLKRPNLDSSTKKRCRIWHSLCTNRNQCCPQFSILFLLYSINTRYCQTQCRWPVGCRAIIAFNELLQWIFNKLQRYLVFNHRLNVNCHWLGIKWNKKHLWHHFVFYNVVRNSFLKSIFIENQSYFLNFCWNMIVPSKFRFVEYFMRCFLWNNKPSALNCS